ncbi:MFS transporter [Acidobacterium sp. S8]|uniref:MFS transporter n=1 Tax=Acidobacterium sp. S8 TaxID=1641854 RepID=UPI0020B1277F|nr:MFS transporter [Acidobacterium sp. S8]
MLDGLEGSLGGSLAGALKSSATLGLTDAQLGLSSSFYLMGAVAGALVFGYLADRYGRRRLFLWTLLLYLCATAATGLSWSLASFTFFRTITGAGIGGEYAAVNSAVDELLPARLRGRVDLWINGTFWLGIILGALVSVAFLSSAVFGEKLGWRLAFLSGVPLGAAVLLMRRFVPESPRWLLRQGLQTEAAAVVQTIEESVRREAGALPPVQTADLVRYESGRRQTLRRLRRLLQGEYRRRALLCFGLMAAQAFFYNSVFFSLSLVLLRYYGVSAQAAGYYFLPIAAANFLGPALLGYLFDSVGRRQMIGATYGLSGLLLFAGSWMFYRHELTVAGQMVWWSLIFFFASAAASSAYLTVSEVFPQEIRASAIAIFYAFGTLAGGVSGPLIFGHLIGSGSRALLFSGYVFGAVAMAAAGLAQAVWGIAAERKPLEMIAPEGDY